MMRVKCLGSPTHPEDIRVVTAVPRPDYGDHKAKHEYVITREYLELGQKRYSPLSGSGEIDKSKDSVEKLIGRSATEPQPIVEISRPLGPTGNDSIKKSTDGRLWLYKDRIYEVDLNDYDQQQVKYLILDFLEKERKTFAQLKRKHES